MTDQPAFIDRAAHEAECARLKRTIARRDAELECYRVLYPGWTYNHELQCLFTTGDHEHCLEGDNG